MSRGLGAAQRYLLDLLHEAQTALPLLQVADLRVSGYKAQDHRLGGSTDVDGRREAQDRAWRTSRQAPASQLESVRRAAARLHQQGLVHRERAFNCVWVTLDDVSPHADSSES